MHTQQPLALPRSIHTDMDAAMEFDNLNVAPQDAPPQGLARELTAPDLVNCLTQGMANAAAELLKKFTQPPLVSAAADAALRERLQQWATALQPPTTKSAATGHVSAFDWLEHRKQSPQKEETWATCPEMTPRKVERRWQPDRAQEYSSGSAGRSEQGPDQSSSQKRCSQSHPWDEVDSKKGRTEG